MGAEAVAFHARPRATLDFDLFFDPTPANARKLIAAIEAYVGAPVDLEPESLLASGTGEKVKSLLIGAAGEIRVDFLAHVKGVGFAEAWKTRVEGPFGAERVAYPSLDILIEMKRAVARPKDKFDLETLVEARRIKESAGIPRARGSRRRSSGDAG